MTGRIKKSEQCFVILGNTAWKKADAAWFRVNRRRSFRVRGIFKGELPDELMSEPGRTAPTHVLVCQVEPGVREKIFTSKSAASGADNDDRLLGLWISLRSGEVRAPGNLMPTAGACQ